MSRRQNKFAQKRYNIASEEVNVYAKTMADFKFNTYRVLTELDLLGLVGSFGPVGSSPNANAATITAGVANLQPASATFPGVVGLGAQSFPSGTKTFTDGLAGTTGAFSSTLTASNLSGSNTGDVTLGTFGSAPNTSGASLAAQVLTQQPADATRPGGVSTTTQTFGGDKTFAGNLAAQKQIQMVATTAGGDGAIYQGGSRIMHSKGTNSLFLGKNTGNFTNTGTSNTGLGFATLGALTSGENNFGAGEACLMLLTDGIQNTAAGNGAGLSGTSKEDNTYFGYSAGNSHTGNRSTFIGSQAAIGAGAVDDCVAIGYEAGSSVSSGSNSIWIQNDGVNADANTIRIGNSTHQKAFMFGVYPNDTPLTDDYRTYCNSTGETHILENQNETLAITIPGQTTVKSAGGGRLLLTNFATPSTNGMTVSSNSIHLTKKGWYQFKVTLHMNVGSDVWCQMNVNGAANESNKVTCVPLTGFETSVGFIFNRWLPADAAVDIDFDIAADTYPAGGGAAPSFDSAGRVLVTMIN